MIFTRSLRPVRSLGRQCRWFSSTCSRHKDPFKILFCGSDQFSIGTLKAVLDAKDVWQSIHVLTPDIQRIGRGGKNVKRAKEIYKCDLLTFAEEQGLSRATLSDIFPPSQKGDRDATWMAPSPFHQPDETHLLLTASFGHIIPNNFLEKFLPANRLNVHPSLLPKYRGAAPIQWTIMNGDETTGISVQRLVERGKGIDGGEIVGSVANLPVGPQATYTSMIQDLAPWGGNLLVQCLRDIMAGRDIARPQDSSQKTRAPKIIKDTAKIDWTRQTAIQIDRMHRGIGHHHPIWFEFRGHNIRVTDVQAFDRSESPGLLDSMVDELEPLLVPGLAWFARGTADRSPRLLVACPKDPGDGVWKEGNGNEGRPVEFVQIKRLWPETKKEVAVKEWWNGLQEHERKRNWVQL